LEGHLQTNRNRWLPNSLTADVLLIGYDAVFSYSGCSTRKISPRNVFSFFVKGAEVCYQTVYYNVPLDSLEIAFLSSNVSQKRQMHFRPNTW